MSRRNAGASLRWKLAVSDAVSVEIDYRDRDTVLHFALTEIVQMRSPFRIIIDVVGHMLGEEDVSPASPQSITRCAKLIPAPAIFSCSFRLLTSLTGPLWMPIRSLT